MPKVSIIISVYNAEKYIKKCIKSAVNQGDVEIIAVNDGSTDNSSIILHTLEKKYKNLKVYDKENGGAGSARNIGLDKATGEFIKFLDADDTLPKGIINEMYNVAKKNNASIVKGNYKMIIGHLGLCRIKDAGNFASCPVGTINLLENKDIMVTEYPSIGNKLFSRELIGNMRFPEKTKWEDLAIVPVLFASSGKIYNMNKTVYNYRMYANTTMNDFKRSNAKVLDVIKCVNLIEKGLSERKLLEEYNEQLEGLYVLHTLFRVENVMLWTDIPQEDKSNIISLLLNIVKKKYPNWEENRFYKMYRKEITIFDIHMKDLNKYINDSYNEDNDIEKLKNKIQLILEKKAK